MGEQLITWTALPNGFKRGTPLLKLSVFVSPRLKLSGQDRGTLQDFRDFWDWPSQLQPGKLSIKLIIDNDTQRPISTEISTDPELRPNSDSWKALFSPSTFVRSHEFPVQREPQSTYGATKMAEILRRGYRSSAEASPYRPADRDTLKDAFRGIYSAIAPGPSPAVFEQLNIDIEDAPAEQFAELRRELGENLLRHDPDRSLDDKLTYAIKLAGRIARSSDQSEFVSIVPDTGSEASALAQFVAFHHRVPMQLEQSDSASAGTEDDSKRVDFHQMLSALGEYPGLMRRLGLVIDVEIPASAIPQSLFGQPRRIRVLPLFTGGGIAGRPYTPNTRYLFDQRQVGSTFPFPIFTAAPQKARIPDQPPSAAHGMEIVGGLLNLALPGPSSAPQTPPFNLVQIDIDGALTKVIKAVRNIVLDEQRPSQPIDKNEQIGAPAFRASGLAVVRSGQASALFSGVGDNEKIEAALKRNEIADVFAEDLVRGYRIDVRRVPANPLVAEPPTAPAWHSLHSRIGTFKLGQGGAVAPLTIKEEGFIQPAFAQHGRKPPAAGAPDPIYVPESLFHWKGWSLSAPPPARPLDLAPQRAPVSEGAPVGLPHLEVSFQIAPHSLPKLRFGDRYQVRARTVDLAGNGLCVGDATIILDALKAQGSRLPILFDDSNRQFRYLRFEPVSPPELALREALTKGESVDVMVIRSKGAAKTVAEGVDEPLDTGLNERHIVPPKAALSTVETHGMLDGAFGPNGNAAHYYNICKRESGTLDDQFVSNTETGDAEFLVDVDQHNPVDGKSTTVPHGLVFVRPDGPSGECGYTIHLEEQLRIPYLPDPLAHGATLFGLPGVRNVSGIQDENGDLKWERPSLAPEAATKLGHMTKIDFGPTSNWPDHQPFRLQLAKLPSGSAQTRPRWNKANRTLTASLAPGDMKVIWISSYPDSKNTSLFGLHDWSGDSESPPADPLHVRNMAQHGALAQLSAARKVTLVHATQRPAKAPVESAATAFNVFKIRAGGTVGYVTGAFDIHAMSTAKIDLLASWDEQEETSDTVRKVSTHLFEVPIPPPPERPTGPVTIASLDQLQSFKFLSPSHALTTEPTRRYLARHEFGDTKHRKITYRLTATSRYREFFPDSITTDPANLIAEPAYDKLVFIPSSAQPPAPEISHIVPTFGWKVDGATPRVTKSTRRGGGLRIYLGKTWYASGSGEQLAIVEGPNLSRWGFDPIHVLPTAPASTIQPNVRPVRLPGSPYDGKIYPFDVKFDDKRKLWYCDIIFRIGEAYFPFKEVALARYQENSQDGKHLSPIIYAGIHQLAPDRTVSLGYFGPTAADPAHRKVTIAVTALAVSTASLDATLEAIQPTVSVTLEEREAARAQWDDDLGWISVSGSDQPIATMPAPQGHLWMGHLLLPAAPGSKQRRIVIREFEVFSASANCPSAQTWIGDSATATRRLVYADTIRLD